MFFGIIIRMYYKEHEPRHFHAEHQSQQGKFSFSGEMTIGNIQSRTALRLIREWAVLQRGRTADELGADEGGSAAQRHCTA